MEEFGKRENPIQHLQVWGLHVGNPEFPIAQDEEHMLKDYWIKQDLGFK